MAGCAMLLVALTCLTTLVVAGTFSRSRAVTGSPIPKAQQVVEARHEVTGEEMAGLPVSLEKIRRGDTVVVNQKGALGLRQVSTSNECVIVKRDNAVQGLYLLGEGSYLVVSDKESKVVRAGTALASARR